MVIVGGAAWVRNARASSYTPRPPPHTSPAPSMHPVGGSSRYPGIMAALRSRFRGVLVGALVGDCLGAYWETQSWQGIHPIDDVKRRFSEQIAQTQSKKAPVITYTDDTALTFAVADSLIQCGKFDADDMARRYVITSSPVISGMWTVFQTRSAAHCHAILGLTLS